MPHMQHMEKFKYAAGENAAIDLHWMSLLPQSFCCHDMPESSPADPVSPSRNLTLVL